MLLEAALLPRNLSSHLLWPFYYGSGSATQIFTTQKVQIQPSPLNIIQSFDLSHCRKKSSGTSTIYLFFCSVGDPDVQVFGPPGSGSNSRRYGSWANPFLIKMFDRTEIMLAKYSLAKNKIFNTEDNVPAGNLQEKIWKNQFFLHPLKSLKKGVDLKLDLVRIRGSAYAPKRHGSATFLFCLLSSSLPLQPFEVWGSLGLLLLAQEVSHRYAGHPHLICTVAKNIHSVNGCGSSLRKRMRVILTSLPVRNIHSENGCGSFSLLYHLQKYFFSKYFENTQSVLWIRIGFNANPALTYYLNADEDPDPGAKPTRIRIGILVRLHKSHKELNFNMKNILEESNRSKNR
jgi:hypothetical protein